MAYNNRITSWHAAVFFQVFGFLIILAYSAWYAAVVFSPNLISEYLPHQLQVNIVTIEEFIPFVIVWGWILFFTIRGSKLALLASTWLSALFLSGSLLSYFTTFDTASKIKPDFGDLVSVPTIVLCIAFNILAYYFFQTTPLKEKNRIAVKEA